MKRYFQGICPGNRLRIIPGVYEDTGQSRGPSPQLSEVGHDLSTLQRQGKRRSWHVQPNQVLIQLTIALRVSSSIDRRRMRRDAPVFSVAFSISFLRAGTQSRRSFCIVIPYVFHCPAGGLRRSVCC